MRIIQIFVSEGSDWKAIYGLGDDGMPYKWNTIARKWDNL